LVHHRCGDGAGLRHPDVANEHAFVVITNDLDFSAILAASAGVTPSVVQIRTQDLLSDVVVNSRLGWDAECG
jgi:predicted nuclease of predicted toxin-antitoxin system